MFHSDEVIGEYRLEQPLGDGALGVVWSARRVDRDEPVALKLMNPERVPPRARNQAFDSLTRALTRTGRLEHDSLQSLFGLALRPEDGVFGVAAELYDGGPFENLGNIGRKEALINALRLLRQIAEALAWLHERNVVHGNLKPSNVLVVPSARGPRIVLLDLCWSAAGLGRRTEKTRIFVSPEQLAKQSPTAASDQWATARMMHQLAVRSAPNRSATEALTALPLPVLRVLKRALEHDPQSRFASMQSFLQALEHAEEELGAAGASAPSGLPTPTLEVSVRDAIAIREEPTAPHVPPPRARPKEDLHEIATLGPDPFEERTFDADRAPADEEDVPEAAAPTEPGMPKPRAMSRPAPIIEATPEPEAEDLGDESRDPTTPLSVQAINPSTERDAPPPARRAPIQPSDPTDVLPAVRPQKSGAPVRAVLMIGVALVVIGASAVVLWKNQTPSEAPTASKVAMAAAPKPTEPPKPEPAKARDPEPEVEKVADTPAPEAPEAQPKLQVARAPEPETKPAPTPAKRAAPKRTAKPRAIAAAATTSALPPADPLEALREGCEANRRADCKKLGDAYISGDGVPRDSRKGREFLARACDLRLISACEPAGRLYARAGSSNAARLARRYLERACDAGRGAACAELAELWKEGRGGRASDRTADAFTRRACQLGHRDSCTAK